MIDFEQHPSSQSQWFATIPGKIAVFVIVTVLSLVAYQGVRDNFFSCDDFAWLRNAVRTVEHPPHILNTDIAGWFRPVGHLAFAINYALFGLSNPLGYAVMSVIFHIFTGYLVFVFVKKITQHARLGLWAAMFFVAHHTHWEAVAWVSILAELLVVFFGLILILCFLQWRQNGGWLWYLGALLALTAALLSAESAVPFPILLFFTDWLYAPKSLKRLSLRFFLPYLPFFIVSVAYAAYEVFLQLHGLHLGSGGDYAVGVQYFIVLGRSLLAYFFPKALIVTVFESRSWLFWTYLTWMGLTTATFLLIFLLKSRPRYRKHMAYGAFWAVLTMLPFCGFTRFTIIDSRHFYPSSVGMALIFGILLESLIPLTTSRQRWKTLLKRGTLIVMTGGFLLWNIVELWHEDAIFEAYASELHSTLTELQHWYADFPEEAEIYFTGMYTPPNFIDDLLFLYYSHKLSQVHHIRLEEFEALAQHSEFPVPTYLFAKHHGKLYDLTPDAYKYPLPPNGMLDIGTREARKFLIAGFSYDEVWGGTTTTFVWSSEPESTIKIRFPSESSDMLMTLRLQPFLYPDFPQQSIAIFLNGHSVETLRLEKNFSTYDVMLPAELLEPVVNLITFQYGYTIAPSEASNGTSQEQRQLAVAFDSIRFTPASE